MIPYFQGLNVRLAFAIGAAAFGSAFQHGYNTGVVNAPAASVKEWIAGCNESQRRAENCQEADICNKCEAEVTLIWSWIVSVMCIGGAMGSAAVGFVSSRFGRRGGLLLNNVFMAIASVFLFASKFSGSYEMLIVGRLVIGINAGLNAGLSPMYLTEISPVSLRGSVGTVYQLIITISILLSQVFGLDTVLGNDHGWPYLFGLTLIPGILQLVTLPFCPESPKHLLLEKNDEEKATTSLAWLRGTNDVQEEMNDLRSEHESIKNLPRT